MVSAVLVDHHEWRVSPPAPASTLPWDLWSGLGTQEYMLFRSVFIAVTVSGALLMAGLLINRARPESEGRQPLPELVRATGRCAQCPRDETPPIVHQFERSEHSRANVTCLDCHQPHDEQATYDHYNFRLALDVTSLNCRGCHRTEYEQFARSRHNYTDRSNGGNENAASDRLLVSRRTRKLR